MGIAAPGTGGTTAGCCTDLIVEYTERGERMGEGGEESGGTLERQLGRRGFPPEWTAKGGADRQRADAHLCGPSQILSDPDQVGPTQGQQLGRRSR